MGAADEGSDVVFAVRVELDVAQHDDVVVAAHIVEGARQGFGRIFFVAAEILAEGLGHALRGIEQAFAVRVVAGPGEQGADGGLGLLLGGALDRLARDLLDDWRPLVLTSLANRVSITASAGLPPGEGMAAALRPTFRGPHIMAGPFRANRQTPCLPEIARRR